MFFEIIFYAVLMVFLLKIGRIFFAKRKHFNSLENFQLLSQINAYKESLPLFSMGGKKHSHAVLLLHGYSASPQEFYLLTEYLKKHKIPYFAPMIFGFGLTELHHLKNAQKEDWIRDAIFAYDILSELADEISVVGHSNGGVLAIVLAKLRKINNLILSSPNIFSRDSELKYKRFLKFPFISELITFAYPFFMKPLRNGRKYRTDTLDDEQAKKCFNYQVLPVSSLKQMWDLQDCVNIDVADYKKITLLLGRYDQTIDISKVEEFFEEKNLKFRKIVFENSAHNLLEDFERDKVSEVIVSVLNS
jgi:carboxylesterase